MSTTITSNMDQHSPAATTSQSSPTLTIASQPILLAPSNSLMLSLRPDKRKWQESFPDNSSKTNKSARHNHADGDSKSQSDEYSSDDSSNRPPSSAMSMSSKPGRKPMSDDETYSVDADGDPKIKRKVQNRAAQRAFRERKERYVRDLEIKIKQIQDNFHYTTSRLMQENHHLRSIIQRLEVENFALKGMYPPPSPAAPHFIPTSSFSTITNANQPALAAPTLNMLNISSCSLTHNLPSPTNSSMGDSFCYQTTGAAPAGSDVIERILSEPLFDDHGSLNLPISADTPAASLAWNDSTSCNSSLSTTASF